MPATDDSGSSRASPALVLITRHSRVLSPSLALSASECKTGDMSSLIKKNPGTKYRGEAPATGFEPVTVRLTVGCSAVELRGKATKRNSTDEVGQEQIRKGHSLMACLTYQSHPFGIVGIHTTIASNALNCRREPPRKTVELRVVVRAETLVVNVGTRNHIVLRRSHREKLTE